jgi:hypothetical protein
MASCSGLALVRFGSAIQEFIASLGEFSFKAAGVDVSPKRKQVEAAAALGAAIERNPSEKATVLWVDDRPRNNS